MILSPIIIDTNIDDVYNHHLINTNNDQFHTNARKGIAHWVLHPRHPLFLGGQQVVLPYLQVDDGNNDDYDDDGDGDGDGGKGGRRYCCHTCSQDGKGDDDNVIRL